MELGAFSSTGAPADHRRVCTLPTLAPLSAKFSAGVTAVKVAVAVLVVVVGVLYIKAQNFSCSSHPPRPARAAGTGIDQSVFR